MKSFWDYKVLPKPFFQWSANNQMKANPYKCHFICSSDLKTSIRIENWHIHNSTSKKMLDVFFDSKLVV